MIFPLVGWITDLALTAVLNPLVSVEKINIPLIEVAGVAFKQAECLGEEWE